MFTTQDYSEFPGSLVFDNNSGGVGTASTVLNQARVLQQQQMLPCSSGSSTQEGQLQEANMNLLLIFWLFKVIVNGVVLGVAVLHFAWAMQKRRLGQKYMENLATGLGFLATFIML